MLFQNAIFFLLFVEVPDELFIIFYTEIFQIKYGDVLIFFKFDDDLIRNKNRFFVEFF